MFFEYFNHLVSSLPNSTYQSASIIQCPCFFRHSFTFSLKRLWLTPNVTKQPRYLMEFIQLYLTKRASYVAWNSIVLKKLYFLLSWLFPNKLHYQVSVCIILCVSQRLRLQTVSKIQFQMACYSYYWVLSTYAWIFWKIVVFFYPFWPFVHMKNNILGH